MENLTMMPAGAVKSTPLILLRLEAVLAFITFISVYRHAGFSWWQFAVLFLVPDVSMLGYLIDARTGSISYNVLHTYAGPALLGAAGYLFYPAPPAFGIALIWAAHIAFDRALGYGLKYAGGFKQTHLGGL